MDADIGQKLYGTLKQYFGYDSFLPGQKEVITDILGGVHTLTVLPTGGGKSLCYQLPACMNDNALTLVITPLIALMEDQVSSLLRRQIQAIAIHSNLTLEEQAGRYRQVRDGYVKVLYISPERLGSRFFWEGIGERARVIRLLVVDEAHCISTWGHDFRPSYLVLPEIIKKLHQPTLALFTATAPPHTRQDIMRVLGFPLKEHIGQPLRGNLHFTAHTYRSEGEKYTALIQLLNEKEFPAIVYCATPYDVDTLSSMLRQHGLLPALFHGELDVETKRANQEAFLEDRVSLMIATKAFGMGIDKPNIRTIIHFQLPGSLEEYVQESGRGGRDGAPAEATLLFYYTDISKQLRFISLNNPPLSLIQRVYKRTRAQWEWLRTRSEVVSIEQIRNALKRDAGGDDTIKQLFGASLGFLLEYGYIKRAGVAVEFPEENPDFPREALVLKKSSAYRKLQVMIHYAKSRSGHREILLNYLTGSTLKFIEQEGLIEKTIKDTLLGCIDDEHPTAVSCASLVTGRRALKNPNPTYTGSLPFLSQAQVKLELSLLQEEGYITPVTRGGRMVYALTEDGLRHLSEIVGREVQPRPLHPEEKGDVAAAVQEWYESARDANRLGYWWQCHFKDFLKETFTIRTNTTNGEDLLKLFSGKEARITYRDFCEFLLFYFGERILLHENTQQRAQRPRRRWRR